MTFRQSRRRRSSGSDEEGFEGSRVQGFKGALRTFLPSNSEPSNPRTLLVQSPATVILAIFTVAVLYSSVGHGGASGYLAVMAFVGVMPEVTTRRESSVSDECAVRDVAGACSEESRTEAASTPVFVNRRDNIP